MTEPTEVNDVSTQRAAMQCIIVAAQMLHQFDLPDLLRRMDRAQSFGPVIDPTLWRDKCEALEQDIIIVEAAIPLWRLGMKLKGQHERTD